MATEPACEHACFGKSSCWSFPSRPGILLHAVFDITHACYFSYSSVVVSWLKGTEVYCLIFHKVVGTGIVEACYVFCALLFTSLLSSCFRRDNNQVCKKDSLLLETLAARDIRRRCRIFSCDRILLRLHQARDRAATVLVAKDFVSMGISGICPRFSSSWLYR